VKGKLDGNTDVRFSGFGSSEAEISTIYGYVVLLKSDEGWSAVDWTSYRELQSRLNSRGGAKYSNMTRDGFTLEINKAPKKSRSE
jgi:hypothetical protein